MRRNLIMDDMNNLNQNPNPQPVPNQTNVYIQPESEPPVTIGDWVLTIFLSGIPCVGLILLLVWAFGSNTPKSKANWAKATLIWAIIGLVLGIICYAIFGATVASLVDY